MTDEHKTLNQDGTVLGEGGGGGGAVANPTGLPAQRDRDMPIGDANPILHELGARREEIPGIAGGASAGDKGVPGWIGSDPSGHGTENQAEVADENMDL